MVDGAHRGKYENATIEFRRVKKKRMSEEDAYPRRRTAYWEDLGRRFERLRQEALYLATRMRMCFGSAHKANWAHKYYECFAIDVASDLTGSANMVYRWNVTELPGTNVGLATVFYGAYREDEERDEWRAQDPPIMHQRPPNALPNQFERNRLLGVTQRIEEFIEESQILIYLETMLRLSKYANKMNLAGTAVANPGSLTLGAKKRKT